MFILLFEWRFHGVGITIKFDIHYLQIIVFQLNFGIESASPFLGIVNKYNRVIYHHEKLLFFPCCTLFMLTYQKELMWGL